jgi:hypothetical protein
MSEIDSPNAGGALDNSELKSFSNSDSSCNSSENAETLGFMMPQENNYLLAKGLQTSKPK